MKYLFLSLSLFAGAAYGLETVTERGAITAYADTVDLSKLKTTDFTCDQLGSPCTYVIPDRKVISEVRSFATPGYGGRSWPYTVLAEVRGANGSASCQATMYLNTQNGSIALMLYHHCNSSPTRKSFVWALQNLPKTAQYTFDAAPLTKAELTKIGVMSTNVLSLDFQVADFDCNKFWTSCAYESQVKWDDNFRGMYEESAGPNSTGGPIYRTWRNARGETCNGYLQPTRNAKGMLLFTLSVSCFIGYSSSEDDVKKFLSMIPQTLRYHIDRIE